MVDLKHTVILAFKLTTFAIICVLSGFAALALVLTGLYFIG